ncbi:prepilin-type cleavage/methylation domain-containing protein [Opitutaceae bacterium TAV4]|uniref:type II secretion system protein n=1 Tax=Geminisphaera colitermitum TaxID=1148786 RepID=UPI000158D53C|nr:type II secretion system protein [Geminisphaera colitermitum]RRJ96772.1 prepilin-type cleavage/methylation domain-containing protein [Opitutaceae bacterium TAV4]RRK00877.1 prepilin-type cleavage/methylation domain-containing protein [Opitutaceae bacterium TAV3]
MKRRYFTRIRTRSNARAFTLIELLTVIAIIGVLAAIIIPTVGKVRSTARKVTCTNNMRQITTAALLFAADNRDQLPGFFYNPTYNRWDFNILRVISKSSTGQPPYSRILHCPLDNKKRPAAAQLRPRSYAYNPYLFAGYTGGTPATNKVGIELGKIANPSQMAMLTEHYSNAAGTTWLEYPSDAYLWLSSIVDAHEDGVTSVSFCDGSVRKLPCKTQQDKDDFAARYAKLQ